MCKIMAAILVNFNNAVITINCVKSLINSTGVCPDVFVVDNASKEADYLLLQRELPDNVELIRNNRNLGYVGGVNSGIMEARKRDYDYYLILNNDTVISPDAADALQKTALRHNNQCIVSGKVYNMDEPNTLQYIGQWCRSHNRLDYPPYIESGRRVDNGEWDKEMEMDMIDDIFWLLPRGVLDTVGLYCDFFFLYGEQNDYAFRAKRQGFKLIYTPKAKLWHYHHKSSGDADKGYPAIQYWKGFSLLLLAYRHLSRMNFTIFMFRVIVKQHIMVIKSLINKENFSPRVASIRGQYSFVAWLIGKKPNSGYNPYVKNNWS